jgi:hypothetical protein
MIKKSLPMKANHDPHQLQNYHCLYDIRWVLSIFLFFPLEQKLSKALNDFIKNISLFLPRENKTLEKN